MKKDFSPRKSILILINYWWVLSILAVTGGIFAFFVSKFHHPVYDAKAILSADINYTQTGQMSEAEQDRAYQAVSSIIVSDAVLEKVIQESDDQGIQIDDEDFLNHFFLERYNANFFLRVDSFSPEEAAILANIWAEASREILGQMILQVNQQRHVNNVLSAIESCYSNLSSFDSQRINCQLLETFQPSLIVSSLENALEVNGNAGIFPAFSISITDFAEASNRPRLNNRNFLISAGVLMGFLVGILLVESGLLLKWIHQNAKRKRDI